MRLTDVILDTRRCRTDAAASPVPTATGILLLCISCLGCTSSVHPLASKETLTEELDLSGRWQRRTGSGGLGPHQFTLAMNTKKPAHAEYWGDDGEQEFFVQVIKLDEHYYLDAEATDDHSPGGGRPRLYLPLHVFARMELVGKQLHLFPIEEHTSMCFLEEHQVPMIVDDDTFTVITAPTARLQQLVRQHWRELFVAQPIVYERLPEKAQSP